MLVLPVLALLLVGIAVVATSASERPRMLSVLGLGVAGLLALLLVVAVLGVGLRGSGDEDHDDGGAGGGETTGASVVPVVPAPPVEVREVDAVVRPRGRSDALDRLPDRTTRLLRVRSDEPVVVRQCVEDGPCRPGVPMIPNEGSSVGLVELRRRVGDADCAVARCTLVVTLERANRLLATVPLWFGRAAPVVPAPAPDVRPTRPEVHPDLPGGRLAAGLAAAAVLLGLAAWLLRRRPDERVADPFWGVDLAVPEWEGVSLDVDDDELLSPAGGLPARRGR